MLERFGAAIPTMLLLVVPVWSGLRLLGAVRAGRCDRPAWFARAAWTLLYLDIAVWLHGFLAGGLDSEQVCTLWHQQPYDAVFREQHRADLFRVFPLSNPCNPDFDLVGGWVNPTIVVLTLLVLTSLAGLLWSARHRAPLDAEPLGRTP